MTNACIQKRFSQLEDLFSKIETGQREMLFILSSNKGEDS